MAEAFFWIANFVFWYPLIMCVIWIGGALIFHFRIERKPPLPVTETPFVSILVPCYNEEENIKETITHLENLNYPHYEVIAINDGSSDKTASALCELAEEMDKLRVVDLKENSGKANALYLGLMASKGEYLVCVDADSILDPNALNYFVPHFTNPNVGERVGAVTGNPRVRNRNTLLSRIQLCEYSSIIGMIKRTQRILGKVMTVSGVVVAFRKRAVLDCGLWDRDAITEDIAITWKLQKRFWDVRYEPNALCWMLVPETLKGLWTQRVRWAQGGIEILLRHWNIFTDWRQRRLFPVYFEQLLSVTWSICWTILILYFLVTIAAGGELLLPIFWAGSYLTIICLIQFFIAIIMDRKYDKDLVKYYLWAIWYPVLYWYFNALVLVRAIPKALKRKKGKYAVWESPDRGLPL
ncbi:biofilm PGA synthesis N-glycosyltransferase PgaC [Evansella vedderi]|uniref:Poly-beta-1,6-N-acetyl-D-glucosamine synthase n=1 Tax=Evansella vedderi TaxID=38282 RepID=A0ABU0A0I2_9BACI|nr:poly-beta-1,6-N-acetyl-D-glucosamine synthase [Evansella vedderi]MDQ0257001.1 biofilm PGA synthesis N-glycosyltransferase PgaC [Evansella vedderi]